MFCMNCGAQVTEGAGFCPKCGVKLEGDRRPVFSADSKQQQEGAGVEGKMGNNINPAGGQIPLADTHQTDVTEPVNAEDTQQAFSDKTTKENDALSKVANIGRVLTWFSMALVFLMSFVRLPISPIVLVVGVAAGSILSVFDKGRRLLSRIVEAAVAIVLLVLVGIYVLPSGRADDKYVQMVKGGTLGDYTQKTVGEAFDDFLDRPKWESGLSDDDERFVNVKGGFRYYDKDAEIVVQFFVDEKNGTFRYNACEINGVPQNNLVFWGLIETIYNGGSESDYNIGSESDDNADSASEGMDSQGEPNFLSEVISIGETQSYNKEYVGNMEVTLNQL